MVTDAAMAKSVQTVWQRIFDTTVGRISDGEFIGFIRVRHQQWSRECCFGSECESGEEDQYQLIVDIDKSSSIMDRNINAAENVVV